MRLTFFIRETFIIYPLFLVLLLIHIFNVYLFQYHGDCCQYRRSWNSTGWSGDHGNGVGYGSASGQRCILDHCGRLVTVSCASCISRLSSYKELEVLKNLQMRLFVYSDRCRTTINVIGDSLGAGIVQHLSRNELASLPHNAQQTQNGADCHATTSIWSDVLLPIPVTCVTDAVIDCVTFSRSKDRLPIHSECIGASSIGI